MLTTFVLLVSFCTDKQLNNCPTDIHKLRYSNLRTCEYDKSEFTKLDWPQFLRDTVKTPYVKSECQMR